jgi:hypothetical protein
MMNMSVCCGRIQLACVALITAATLARADFQGSTHMMPFDEDTIGYSKTQSKGPVATLQARMDRGDIKLTNDASYGYLLSILDALRIPKSSQMLVFSKTSFQRERISPKTPRSLFFNDDVYVGFIPGSSILEFSEADPKLGGVFYTFDQRQTGKPKFARTDQCLECHASAKTMGVPGHIVRSFATDESGVVDITSGTSLVNHRTPLEERWGGWYVTGTHGNQSHRGNLIGQPAFERHEKEPNYLGNVTNLHQFFDPTPYLSDQSDIIALMVLEHQTHMHNFITRLNYESTIMLQQYGHINYLRSVIEAFVKYMLFVEEAPISSPLKGTTSFVDDFARRGPFDQQGRSLRDFDLETRLFKYPCSFLIYSDAFEALPTPAKDRIYTRLWEILSGKEKNDDYVRLSPQTRRALIEIIADTKKGLPACWKAIGSKAESKQATPANE